MKTTRTLVSAVIALSAVRAGAQGRIAGTVYDSLSARAPLAGATVVLVERSRYATTDSRGHFEIDSVPDGHYTIGFMHPALDSLDLTAPVVAVEVAGGRRATVALVTPGPAAFYARVCPGTYDVETGVVVGRVRDVDDRSALADAAVSTDWTEFTITGGHAAGHRVRAVARTNRDGLYLLCGVPTTVQVDVHTDVAGFSAGPSPLLLNDRLIGRLDFSVSRRDSAARVTAFGDSAAVVSSGPAGTASLRGRVTGGDGRPLRDAVVGVLGTARLARTDATGTFLLDRIPAGTRTIEVRSIGLTPMTATMDFATNAARDTTLSIGRQAQVLTPMAVVGRIGTVSWMERQGFEKRRIQGMRAFVTEADIARHEFSDLTQILEGVRGVTIEWTCGHPHCVAFPVPFLIGITSVQSGSVHCLPNFYLDGAPYHMSSVDDFDELSASLPPKWIKGVEVYSNPGAMPAEFDLSSSTGCGSIVIWTR
jgi:hypothetical protein